MRSSDWSSDVCSSDLLSTAMFAAQAAAQDTPPDQETASETAAEGDAKAQGEPAVPTSEGLSADDQRTLGEIIVIGERRYRNRTETARKRVRAGQSEQVRVDCGGSRNIKKKKKH